MPQGVMLNMERYMTDFNILPAIRTAHSSSDQTVTRTYTQNSAHHSYAVASSLLHVDEIVRGAPSFSSFMRGTLAEAMKEGPRTNPDLLFINTPGEDDSKSSLSALTLTHAFFKFLMQGADFQGHDDWAVYVRRDSSHRAYLERGGYQKDDVVREFKRMAVNFWMNYERTLGEYWNTEMAMAESGSSHDPVSRRQTLGAVFQSIVRDEVDYALARTEFSQEDADTCHAALSQRISGFSTPVIVSAAGENEVTGCLVYSPNTDSGGTPDGQPVYVYDFVDGWRKYTGLQAFEHALQQRISDPETAALVLAAVPEHVRQPVIDAEQSDFKCTYKGIYQHLPNYYADALINKQLLDLVHEFKLIRDDPHDVAFALSELDAAVALDDLSAAVQARVAEVAAWERARIQPHWLKFGATSEQAEYAKREKTLLDKEARLADLTSHVGSPESYARIKIAEYLDRKLWYTVDPEQVVIDIKDALTLDGQRFVVSYKQTLLEFVLSGIPTVEKFVSCEITMPEGYESPRWSFSFLTTMVSELSVASEFAAALIHAHQRDDQVRSAAIEVVAAKMALSALAAKMRGHITAQTHEALVAALYSDEPTQGLKAGGVWMHHAQRRFEDAVVFKGLSAEKPFLLYAPGGPEGWEFREFYDWRRLSMEICGWAANPEGAAYIDDQIALSAREKNIELSFSARIKPHEWTEKTLTFVEIGTGDTLSALNNVVEHKAERVLGKGEYFSQANLRSQFPEETQKKITLDARFTAFARYFNSISGLIPYHEAARLECKRLIDEHLKRKQIDMDVDPDTIYFDLDSPDIQPEPDFGPYTKLKKLTDIFVEGFSHESYKFHTNVAWYSSVGQDVSAITPAFVDNAIRQCDFAARYLKRVKNHKSTDIVQNNKRYAAYDCALRYKMQSDAVKDYTSRKLDTDQYRFITSLIGLPHTLSGAPIGPIPAGGMVKPLEMNGVTIHGGYILFKKGPSDSKLFIAYTPDAPDGISFRIASSLIASIKHVGMDKYFYHRVNYGRQRIIGTLIFNVKNGIGHYDMIEPEFAGPYTVNWKREYDSVLDHLYKDADAQTESGYERLFLGWYLPIRKYGSMIVEHIPGRVGDTIRLVWHSVHAIVDVARAIYVYQTGDRAAARDYFFSAANEILKVAQATRKLRKTFKQDRIKRLLDRHNNVTDVIARY